MNQVLDSPGDDHSPCWLWKRSSALSSVQSLTEWLLHFELKYSKNKSSKRTRQRLWGFLRHSLKVMQFHICSILFITESQTNLIRKEITQPCIYLPGKLGWITQPVLRANHFLSSHRKRSGGRKIIKTRVFDSWLWDCVF